LIAIDKYGSLGDPQVGLVFDIAATEPHVRNINKKIKEEARRAGVPANSIEWSIELWEMNLARQYNTGEYPNKACLRPLSEASIEIIEDFIEKDLGSDESYEAASKAFLATSLFLFSIAVGVISVSIVLSFRHKKGL